MRIISIVTLLVGRYYIRNKYKELNGKIETIFVSTVLVITSVTIIYPPLIYQKKASDSKKIIEAVTISNIADEMLLSAKGNSQGVRLMFEITFPEEYAYKIDVIHGSVLAYGDDRLLNLINNNLDNAEINPKPVLGKNGEKIFKSDTPYHYVVDFIPGMVTDGNNTPCLLLNLGEEQKYDGHIQSTEQARQSRIKKIITMASTTPFNFPIFITNTITGSVEKSIDYQTKGTYSLKDFYDSAIREGIPFCSFLR